MTGARMVNGIRRIVGKAGMKATRRAFPAGILAFAGSRGYICPAKAGYGPGFVVKRPGCQEQIQS